MSNRKMSCSFTGHRRLPHGELPLLKQRLSETIEALISKGVYRFLNGGALGFDALSAGVVLELKKKHEAVELVMVLPCRDQDKGWAAKDKIAYQEILAAADEVEYVSEEYFDGCMKLRNMRLVEESDYCIAYLRNPRSGSAQTVRLSKEKGIPVFNLAEGKAQEG